MKNSYNVLTYYYNIDGSPDRIRDKISLFLWKHKVFKVHDEWTILDKNDRDVGAFYHISGSKWLVNLLSWLTNITRGGTEVELSVDNEGKFTTAKENGT